MQYILSYNSYNYIMQASLNGSIWSTVSVTVCHLCSSHLFLKRQLNIKDDHQCSSVPMSVCHKSDLPNVFILPNDSLRLILAPLHWLKFGRNFEI